jgi:hypothetical protein
MAASGVQTVVHSRQMAIRRQATLYVPPPSDISIESLRTRFNPAQSALIRAHVTLCREDEVCDWDRFADRLRGLAAFDVSLHFDTPIRNGNLVYLPTKGSTDSFVALRSSLLSTLGTAPRRHDPHITLIHPRNGTCSKSEFDEISSQCEPFTVNFCRVTLIEQVDGGPWRDLASFP